MIRKASLITLFFILSCLYLTPNLGVAQEAAPSANFFEEFLKGLMEADDDELEEMFGKPEEDKSIKPIETKKEEIKKPLIPEKKLSKEELFLKPTEDKELVQKLDKDKKEAFLFYIDQFEDNVKNLEKSFSRLSILEKEELDKVNYKNIINELKAELGNIKSKSSLRKGLFLPEQNNTRKDILSAIKELESVQKQIKTSEKKSEEDVELEAIEELERRAKKSPAGLIKKTDINLQNQIKNLISQKLVKIKDELAKIKVLPGVAKELEAKKSAKIKLEAQAAKSRPGSSRPGTYAPPSSSGPGYGGHGGYDRPSKSYGDYPDYGGGYGGRGGYGGYGDYDRGYDYDKKSGEFETGDDKPSSEESGTTPGGFAGEQKETKDYVQEIAKLAQNNLELLNQVLVIYDKAEAKNKQPAYREIFHKKLLSKVVKNLEQIENFKGQLPLEQDKKLKESGDAKGTEFEALVKKFVPIGVRLCKNPAKKEYQQEKEAALSLINDNDQQEEKDKAVIKYEEEILKEIDADFLKSEDFDLDINKLDKLRVNLQILTAAPRNDNVTKVLKEKDLLTIVLVSRKERDTILQKLFKIENAPLGQAAGETWVKIDPNYKELDKLKAKFAEEIEKEETGIEDKQLRDKFIAMLDKKLDTVKLTNETTTDQAVTKVLPILKNIKGDLIKKTQKLSHIEQLLIKMEEETAPEEE